MSKIKNIQSRLDLLRWREMTCLQRIKEVEEQLRVLQNTLDQTRKNIDREKDIEQEASE